MYTYQCCHLANAGVSDSAVIADLVWLMNVCVIYYYQSCTTIRSHQAQHSLQKSKTGTKIMKCGKIYNVKL